MLAYKSDILHYITAIYPMYSLVNLTLIFMQGLITCSVRVTDRFMRLYPI